MSTPESHKRARTAEVGDGDATSPSQAPVPSPVVCLLTQDSGEDHTEGSGCYGFLTLEALVAAGGQTPLVSALADILKSDAWRSEMDKYPGTPMVELYGVDGTGTIGVLCGTEAMAALLEAKGSPVADAKPSKKFDLCSALYEHTWARVGVTGADTIPAAAVRASGNTVVAYIDVNLHSV